MDGGGVGSGVVGGGLRVGIRVVLGWFSVYIGDMNLGCLDEVVVGG